MGAPSEAAKYCERCGRKASPEARFCGGCGRPFEAGSDSGEGADPGVPRSPSPAAATAAPAAPVPPEAETDVLTFRPLPVSSFLEAGLCVLTLGLAWVVLKLLRLRSSYRITSQRIEIRTGFLDVTRRNVELYRVQDLELREPLFLRLRGSGEIVVRSMDVGEPEILLDAVPDAAAVHDTLRRLVTEERRRTHVRLIE